MHLRSREVRRTIPGTTYTHSDYFCASDIRSGYSSKVMVMSNQVSNSIACETYAFFVMSVNGIVAAGCRLCEMMLWKVLMWKVLRLFKSLMANQHFTMDLCMVQDTVCSPAFYPPHSLVPVSYSSSYRVLRSPGSHHTSSRARAAAECRCLCRRC